MINILSINCSLAFAPYLIDSLQNESPALSLTVRQGGSGMVIARDDSTSLIYRNRRANLDGDSLRHYHATIELRTKSYEISLMSEEVVLASFNGSLLLSHPQSELWLEPAVAYGLLAAYRSGEVHPDHAIPEWLRCSVAAGRLLLSDQRTGRWVLLGRDHIAEFERRLSSQEPPPEFTTPSPPVIPIKGVEIHLQSAFKLARTLRDFGQTRQVRPYQEATPEFKLGIAMAVEGIQISDANTRVGITAREAAKWADIIEAELIRWNTSEVIRGKITTVIADGSGGRFVLQWGDEVFVPAGFPDQAGGPGDPLVRERVNGFDLLLDRKKSACVALTNEELSVLYR